MSSFNNKNSGFVPGSPMGAMPTNSTNVGMSDDRVRLMEMDLHTKNLQLVQD